jgi:hypothetical protein
MCVAPRLDGSAHSGEGGQGMTQSINADWHRAHVLGSGAPMADRIVWHQEHSGVCGCRPIPESVLKAIAKQEPTTDGSGE